MIVLPNTPPEVKVVNNVSFPPDINSLRGSLLNANTETYTDLLRYVVNLEEYTEQLFEFAATKATEDLFNSSSKIIIADNVPWTNIVSRKKPVEWTLQNELETCLLAISLVYTRIGSELINELIELESDDTNDQWKQVVHVYKKAISYIKFVLGAKQGTNGLNSNLFAFLEKINTICIQMSILSKSSWINRKSYNQTETFNTLNNGTLCRVAIYVTDELKNCKSLLTDILANKNYALSYNTSDWAEYLSVIEKYATAYAGLFLSIETYQKNKLGHAIGLLNFCLVNLQSKKISDLKPKKSKFQFKLKSKLSNKRNEAYINNLQSTTTLNLKSSVFNQKSGIILKDITYLFDQLMQLHLKFTKENDNLVFDTVADYQDIYKDSKWPLGSVIPVSNIAPYKPKVLSDHLDHQATHRPYY